MPTILMVNLLENSDLVGNLDLFSKGTISANTMLNNLDNQWQLTLKRLALRGGMELKIGRSVVGKVPLFKFGNKTVTLF